MEAKGKEIPWKVSRKSKNCWMSKMQTIQLKTPEILEKFKWNENSKLENSEI